MMFSAIVKWFVNFATGGIIDKAEKIVADYLGAATDEQKTQAALAAQDLANRTAIVQSEIASRILQWPRFMFEAGAALYWVECIVIDKVLASWLHKIGIMVDWSTDGLSPELTTTWTLIVGALFGARVAENIVSKITGR